MWGKVGSSTKTRITVGSNEQKKNIVTIIRQKQDCSAIVDKNRPETVVTVTPEIVRNQVSHYDSIGFPGKSNSFLIGNNENIQTAILRVV